jgi:Mn-dependent DtxR family transcriptional regulator
MNGITASQAAYLGELFRLGGESGFVNPGAWAETLGVSPAAVSRMSRRLEGAGLIERKPYRGVRLTPRSAEGVKAVRRPASPRPTSSAPRVRMARGTTRLIGSEIADEMLVLG